MKKQKIFAISVIIASFLLSGSFFYARDYLKHATSLGLIGLFLINFVSSAALFVSAPAFLSVIAGGSLYPPLLVALISAFGSSIGDFIGYALGHSGRKLIHERLNKKIMFRVLEKYFHRYGGILIFVFSFIPNFIFDSVGIIAGVFGYPPVRYIILVFLGRFLRFLVLAYFGKYL